MPLSIWRSQGDHPASVKDVGDFIRWRSRITARVLPPRICRIFFDRFTVPMFPEILPREEAVSDFPS